MSRRAVLVKVTLRDGEDTEHLIKRFKKMYQESGVLFEVRDREFYKSPSLKRRLKREAAQKRRAKEMRKNGYISEQDK